MELKNVWICGLGGVGGYFGGKIAHYINQSINDNYETYFLARGAHLEEIKTNGLELHTSDNEKFICQPTLASNDISDFPTPDLCLICVKSYDLDDLIISIKDKLGDNTIIISLMNGFDIYARIRKNLKKCIVLPTCVYVGSHVEKPGLVIQSGNPGFFCSGLDLNYPNFNPKRVIDFFEEMEIKIKWNDDPYPVIWEKYLLVASFALVCAHRSQTLGEVISDKESIKILMNIMKEIVFISEKMGIKLPVNIIQNTINFCKDYPDVKPSYMRDVEKGKKNEGDLFGGAIIRMGKELGVPTPTTISVYRDNTLL